MAGYFLGSMNEKRRRKIRVNQQLKDDGCENRLPKIFNTANR